MMKNNGLCYRASRIRVTRFNATAVNEFMIAWGLRRRLLRSPRVRRIGHRDENIKIQQNRDHIGQHHLQTLPIS